MLCILCIVFYVLYTLHCILCILYIFDALCTMHCVLCIVFYALYTMDCILCTAFYLRVNTCFENRCRPTTDRPTDQKQTDRPMDIVTYRAAITAKNVIFLSLTISAVTLIEGFLSLMIIQHVRNSFMSVFWSELLACSDTELSFSLLLSFFCFIYFSPRRCYRRVLKFCIGF